MSRYLSLTVKAFVSILQRTRLSHQSTESKMATRFFRYFSKRTALCSVLCALLMSDSIAGAVILKQWNGKNYTLLDNNLNWINGNSSCPQGLLWLENMAELNFVVSNFPLDHHVWLAAKNHWSQWANGRPFPFDVPVGTRKSEQCACLNIRLKMIHWSRCSHAKHIICKPLCSSSRSSSISYIRSIAYNRRQTGYDLATIIESSDIACSRRCLEDSACCAFEFHAVSGRCRLLSFAREELWFPKEGSVIFGIEG